MLAERLIALKATAPIVDVPTTPITVVTNRFFLEDLVWSSLCRAMDAHARDQAVKIVADNAQHAVRDRFCGLRGDLLAGGVKFFLPTKRWWPGFSASSWRLTAKRVKSVLFYLVFIKAKSIVFRRAT
jgi:hypothetical protein